MNDARTTPTAVHAGARLGERYTLTRLIGTGGMASVWAAQDDRLQREVAIKVISDTLALDATFVDRFAREAQIAAALSHPHVVGVFDYSNHGGRPYLVMEYVPGGTISTRLKEDGPTGTRSRSPANCSTRWRTSTPRASSTATSSRPMCCSGRTAAHGSPISASRT